MSDVTEAERNAVLAALSTHIGAARGVHAPELAREVFDGDGSEGAQRRLRTVIEDLRRGGSQICGTPKTGYFIACTEEELRETCEFLYSRSITGLAQVAAMMRVALPDFRQQLRLQLQSKEPA